PAPTSSVPCSARAISRSAASRPAPRSRSALPSRAASNLPAARTRSDVSDWTERLIAGSPCLTRHPHGRTIATIAGAALAAVDPRACVLRSTHLLRKPAGEAAVIGEFVFDLADDPARPGPREHGAIHVFGAGKASAAMAAALVERFGARIGGGLVIVKHPPDGLEP